jgi:hypothetical protein
VTVKAASTVTPFRLVLMLAAVSAATATPIAVPASVIVLLPRPVARESAIELIEMVWFAFAPTWKACDVNVPSSRFRPLKLVWLATRVISAANCWASASREARSLRLLVAFAAWTDNSRRRWRLLPISPSAPSAVCASEMPSFALRAAWFRPRIWAVIRSEIARPAESSFALLMRMPEDIRCNEVARAFCDWFKFRCAFSEATLVLIT